MSVVESLMLGTPVIVANSGGLPEMVTNDVGKVIDFYSENTISKLKEILIKKYDYDRTIIKEYYKEHFGEQKHVERITSL